LTTNLPVTEHIRATEKVIVEDIQTLLIRANLRKLSRLLKRLRIKNPSSEIPESENPKCEEMQEFEKRKFEKESIEKRLVSIEKRLVRIEYREFENRVAIVENRDAIIEKRRLLASSESEKCEIGKATE